MNFQNVLYGTAVNSVCHTTPNMQSNVITTGEKKKVFVTGSGNIEVTQVSQPIAHPPNVMPNITPNITSNVSKSFDFLLYLKKSFLLLQ